MSEEVESIAAAVHSYLGMKFRPVGVKILEEATDGDRPQRRMTFCRMVREAAMGKDLIAQAEDLDCASAEVCLGFREPRYVKIEPRIKVKTKMVRIGPLKDADVVLLILNPEQVMVMAVLLEGIGARFNGDMAICGEAVAQVYNDGEPNVSFLCQGARTLGGFQENEVVLSMPYAKFLELPMRMSAFASLSRSMRAKAAQLLLRIR